MTRLDADLKRFLFLVPYVARRADGVPTAELCDKLGCTEAELRRLVDRASAVGTPDGTPDEMVEIHLEADRVHVELPQRFTAPPRFSLEEALALLLALSPLRSAALPELAGHARALSERLMELASRSAAEVSADVIDRVVVEPERVETPEHLRQLEKAVRERRVVAMEYYTASRDVLTSRELRPSGLVQYRGAWYVIGHDERTFKVERIRSLALTDERFEPPALDMERYRRGVFGDDDGGFEVEVQFRDGPRPVPARSRHQTKVWIRGTQGGLALLGPEDLRDELVAETRELLGRYVPDPGA